jgi:S1-C subfamily serine protease
VSPEAPAPPAPAASPQPAPPADVAPDVTPPTGIPFFDSPPQYEPQPGPPAAAAPTIPPPGGPAPVPSPNGGRGARRWPTIVASGVVAALVALGVSVVTSDDSTTVSPASDSAAAPSDSNADAGTETGSDTATDTANADDPVAQAAATIAPAVVQLETQAGLGSGVIYSEDGYILTAAHVVGNADSVQVRLADGSSVDGTVVGADEETDVAVVQIDAAEVPTVATLATDEELVVGQLTVAVGSPFGLDQTVTSGIVSATDRSVNGIATVQTDAAINPGNSGGPLVDREGRVIGINDSIISESGGSDGLGFAISIDLARLVADQLVAGEQVSLAQIGVGTATPPDGQAGALVEEVLAGSAADDAGIEVGDVIVSVDGEDVVDGSQLRARVLSMEPGTEIKIVVERDGQPVTIDLTLGSTSD